MLAQPAAKVGLDQSRRRGSHDGRDTSLGPGAGRLEAVVTLPLQPGAPETVAWRSTGEPAPVYLTAAAVAGLLDVDEKTVLRWSLQDASMPVLRRGRVVRFHRERLMLWLERQEPRGSRQSAQRQRQSG